MDYFKIIFCKFAQAEQNLASGVRRPDSLTLHSVAALEKLQSLFQVSVHLRV